MMLPHLYLLDGQHLQIGIQSVLIMIHKVGNILQYLNLHIGMKSLNLHVSLVVMTTTYQWSSCIYFLYRRGKKTHLAQDCAKYIARSAVS